jgi:hypothetical protein
MKLTIKKLVLIFGLCGAVIPAPAQAMWRDSYTLPAHQFFEKYPKARHVLGVVGAALGVAVIGYGIYFVVQECNLAKAQEERRQNRKNERYWREQQEPLTVAKYVREKQVALYNLNVSPRVVSPDLIKRDCAWTDIDAEDILGRTALFYALQQNDRVLSEWLVQEGADINAIIQHTYNMTYTPESEFFKSLKSNFGEEVAPAFFICNYFRWPTARLDPQNPFFATVMQSLLDYQIIKDVALICGHHNWLIWLDDRFANTIHYVSHVEPGMVVASRTKFANEYHLSDTITQCFPQDDNAKKLKLLDNSFSIMLCLHDMQTITCLIPLLCADETWMGMFKTHLEKFKCSEYKDRTYA